MGQFTISANNQVEFVDKNVDYAHRIGIADVVVEALGK
jgi:hypothetical protein